MKIYLAGDAYAWESITELMDLLQGKAIAFENLGAKSPDDSIGLTDFIPTVCKKVQQDEAAQAILLCGTGAGVEIGANRFKGIRASLCVKPQQAAWARQKDNANVLCLSAWDIAESDNLVQLIETWLTTDFDGSEKRRAMLSSFDTW